MESIKSRITKSLARSKADVFVRADFEKFGGYDQVGRALREIIAEGRLVKVGYGLYSKASPSALSGKPIPTRTMVEIGLQALQKLGVNATIGRAAQEYAAGKTTQMPGKERINIGKARISRRIGFGKRALIYEKN